MLDIKLKTKIARAIQDNGFFRLGVETAFKESAELIIVPAYKTEVPVNKGFLRNNVRRIGVNSLHHVVTTTANNKGFRYPAALHEGTGIYKGANDYGRNNYVRNGGYTDKDRMRFAGMAKRGYKFSIKPNKFADRAKNLAQSPVIRFIGASLRKLTNES